MGPLFCSPFLIERALGARRGVSVTHGAADIHRVDGAHGGES